MFGLLTKTRWIGLAVACAVTPSMAAARTETVEWDQPQENTISGYKVHYGSSSGVYTTTLDIGGRNRGSNGYFSYSLTVPDGDDIYIAMTAYDGSGESPLSNERFRAGQSGGGDPGGGDPGGGDPGGDPGPGATLPPYFINSGSSADVTIGGTTWTPDDAFALSGAFGSTSSPIANTTADVLYQSERWGGDYGQPMVYEFPAPAGTYRIRLHFAETWFRVDSAGDRQFDVHAEGVSVLPAYDIFAEAGYETAIVEEFDTTVSDGSITITFSRLTDQTPRISAIEIVDPPDAPPAAPNPPLLLEVLVE